MIKNLQPIPKFIGAYGYWGQPSPTAVTPFKKILFVVFYIQKGIGESYGVSIIREFFK